MITRLTLRNFKSVGEQTYEFTQFDLLVGRNNSGKSTVLQALAIWQFCVDEFCRSKRSGSTGIQQPGPRPIVGHVNETFKTRPEESGRGRLRVCATSVGEK